MKQKSRGEPRKRPRGAGGKTESRLADGLAMVEVMLRAETGHAVWQVIETLADVLVDLGLFRAIWLDRDAIGDHLDGRIPDWRGRDRKKIESDLREAWNRKRREHEILKEKIVVLETRHARDDTKAQLAARKRAVEWDFFLADEELARSLLRTSLAALGVPAKKAADLVKGLPRQSDIDQRMSHLVDFAAERLSFSAPKAGGAYPTSAQVFLAYDRWCDATRVERGIRFGKTALLRELAKSSGTQRHTYGSEGGRARGLSGLVLKPAKGKAGAAAKLSRRRFRRWLQRKFPEEMMIARKKLSETT
jgi:hypothetical protein